MHRSRTLQLTLAAAAFAAGGLMLSATSTTQAASVRQAQQQLVTSRQDYAIPWRHPAVHMVIATPVQTTQSPAPPSPTQSPAPIPSPSPPPVLPSQGGVLSAQQVAQLWIQAGGPAAVAPVMACIAWHESGDNPAAVNPNDNGQSDWGLWQISNGTHSMPVPDILNPAVNAQQAVAKYRSGGFGQWGTAGDCGV